LRPFGFFFEVDVDDGPLHLLFYSLPGRVPSSMGTISFILLSCVEIFLRTLPREFSSPGGITSAVFARRDPLVSGPRSSCVDARFSIFFFFFLRIVVVIISRFGNEAGRGPSRDCDLVSDPCTLDSDFCFFSLRGSESWRSLVNSPFWTRPEQACLFPLAIDTGGHCLPFFFSG